MVRRSTWLLLVILLALVGASVYVQRQKDAEQASPTATSSMVPLFGPSVGQSSGIRVENAAGDKVEIVRSSDGAWTVVSPEEGPADQAAAEAATTQVGALRSLSRVDLQADVIGLDKPDYTITITFTEGAVHRLRVGSVTPINDGYYCQVDGGDFQVVDKFGLDALIGMLKSPPYPATPTPQVTTTELGSPTGTIVELTPAADGAKPAPSPSPTP